MKYALLALLAHGPAHGYELKQSYEDLFDDVLPPLNAGQIYTTLSRLERDELVMDHRVEQEDRPNKRVYELTPAGRQTLAAWLEDSIKGPRLKDDFFMKLVLARTASIADPCELIERQRITYLQDLRQLNEQAMHLNKLENPVPLLLVQGAILHLKADLEWLDECEARLG